MAIQGQWWLLLAVALCFRCWRLGSAPGLNGDEAWYGVWVLEFLHGDAVAWTTPTGNLVNPFFLIPTAFFHLWLPPSVPTLRLTSLVCGVAALLANYLLAQRTFGRTFAVISTLLLAVMPVNLAYSRFAWDASQTLLASVLVVYPALLACRGDHRGAWLAVSTLALLMAVWVHPTNVFLLPFPLGAMMARWGKAAWFAVRSRRFERYRRGSAVVLLFALMATAWWGRGWCGIALAHASEPSNAPGFVLGCIDLLAGTTVYRFITGTPGAAQEGPTAMRWLEAAHSAAWLCLLLAALVPLFRRREAGHAMPERVLLGACAVGLCGFFLIAGPEALRPHFERYGLWLVLPVSVLIARGLEGWLSHSARARRTVLVGTTCLAWIALSGFWVNYFWPLSHGGGNSHVAFRTDGRRDPKIVAVEALLARRDPVRPIRLVVDGWWNYWPARYATFDTERVTVETWQAFAHAGARAGASEEIWMMAFASDPVHREMHAWANSGEREVQCTPLPDGAGRPLLSVWVVRRANDADRLIGSSAIMPAAR